MYHSPPVRQRVAERGAEAVRRVEPHKKPPGENAWGRSLPARIYPRTIFFNRKMTFAGRSAKRRMK